MPWWCAYARVTWRVKALHGLAGFGLVQGQLRQNGIPVPPNDKVPEL